MSGPDGVPADGDGGGGGGVLEGVIVEGGGVIPLEGFLTAQAVQGF